MIIQCSGCQARYHYDETRFGNSPTKKIRCTKCSTVFEIQNPVLAGDSKATDPGSDEFALDETGMTEPKKGKGPMPGAPARAMPAVTSPPGQAQPGAQQAAPPPAAPRPAAAPQRPAPAPPAPRPPAPAPPPPPPALDGTARAYERVTGFPEPEVGMSSAAARTTDRVPVPGVLKAEKMKLPDAHRLSLAVIAGPDSGRIFEVDKPRVVIGRANSDIILADIQCSRQHAAIEAMDNKVYLVDLGSTNGTYVADQRITRVELDNRSEFELGTTTVMLIKTPVTMPEVG